MRPDGSDRRNLTQNPAIDIDPSWSPDGRWVSFTSNRDGDFEVFVMRRNGDDQTQLTFNEAQDILTGWSPEGEEIAFESHRDGGLVPDPPPDEPGLRFSDVFTMDADGDDQRNVTNTATELDSDPNWGPEPDDDDDDEGDREED
jgi:dipeptidyl aminopeptidase/acylaminoacyl peptidase